MGTKKITIIKFIEGLDVQPIEMGAIEAMAYKTYPSSAAFVTDKGMAATDADVFFNSTTGQVEFFQNGDWFPQTNDLVIVINNLVDGMTLPILLKKDKQTFYIQGNGAPCSLSGTPFGTDEPVDGKEICIIGSSDLNPVKISFSDIDFGCYSNGDRTIKKGQSVTYKYIKAAKRYFDTGANY